MEKVSLQKTELPHINSKKQSKNKVKYISWTPGHNNHKGEPIKKTMELVRNRRNVPYQRVEFEGEEKLFLSDADIMRAPSDEVMYGSPHHIIDNMNMLQRMLVEEQSFISFSNRIFRMVDPVTQAKSLTGDKRLVWQIDKEGKKTSSWTPVQTNLSEISYEFSNGGGMDQEEISDWRHGGTSPVLLSLAHDLMPEHQCDEAQVIILEHLMEQDIPIPKSSDVMIAIVSGDITITVRSENDAKEYKLSTNQKMPVYGPKLVTLTCTSDNDCIIVIGKTMIGNIPEDMLTKAMSLGYQDVYLMHDKRDQKTQHNKEEYTEDNNESLVEYTQYNLHMVTGLLPSFSEINADIPKDPQEQKVLWRTQTGGSIPQNEWRIRLKHRKIIDILSVGIDSPYIGRGFRPPAPRWQRIMQELPSLSSYKADERRLYFEALHIEAKKVSSYSELYGTRIWECHFCKTTNDHTGHHCSNPHCKEYFANTTGFYGKIRQKNVEDRDLVRKWSEKPQKIKIKQDDGTEIWKTIPSVFHQKRKEYADKLRNTGEYTEKSISRKLWYWFDRENNKRKAIYEHLVDCICGAKFTKSAPVSETQSLKCPTCKQIGKVINIKSKIAHDTKGEILGSKTTEESIWRQHRSKAFQELWCTKSQWNTIYCQLKIQRYRISLIERSTDNRTKAYNIMRSLFSDCNTYIDLKEFKELIYQQKIEKDGTISKLSLIDKVSFNDEKRIRIAWTKRWKEIAAETRKKAKPCDGKGMTYNENYRRNN